MRSKDEIREAVWAAMELAGAGHTKKLHDKIPHFRGFEEAAAHVFDLPTWHAARVIKGKPRQGPTPPCGARRWPRARWSTWPCPG